MNLKETLNNDFIKYFKEKKVIQKNILSLLKNKIYLFEKTNNKEINDDEVIKFIKEDINSFDKILKTPWLPNEFINQTLLEKETLSKYLPETIDSNILFEDIQTKLNSNEIQKNIGSIMFYIKEKYWNKANMKELSPLVKTLL